MRASGAARAARCPPSADVPGVAQAGAPSRPRPPGPMSSPWATPFGARALARWHMAASGGLRCRTWGRQLWGSRLGVGHGPLARCWAASCGGAPSPTWTPCEFSLVVNLEVGVADAMDGRDCDDVV